MKKLDNICRFIPVFGLLIDTWTSNTKYFNKWWFIVYHCYSSFIYFPFFYLIMY